MMAVATVESNIVAIQNDEELSPIVVALQNLNWQRENDIFCDITIVVKDARYRAHRNILAAFSPYFRAMFVGEMVERTREEVEIHEVTPPIFEKLLKFIYTGDIEITSENCQGIFAAADMLQLTAVVTSCCAFLRNQLDPSNVIGIYLFAENFCRPDLTSVCETYIYQHFTLVIQEEEFLTVPKYFLQHLLKSEDLKIDCEFVAFNASIKWVLNDAPSRRRYVYDILSHIRFPLISPSALDTFISECSDLSLRIVLRKLVQEQSANRIALHKMKPYYFQPRKSARKSVFVIGGMCYTLGRRWTADCLTLDVVESFDTYSQQWSKQTSLTTPRFDHGVVYLDGQIFVIGGESDSLLFDSVESYDITLKKWTVLAPMTSPRSALGCCVVNGRIIAMGGWMGETVTDTMEVYDTEANVWKQQGRMTSPRYAMAVICYKGLIYVLGGKGTFDQSLATCDVYDPDTNTWHRLPDMLNARSNFGAAMVDETIYVVGGNQHSQALRTVEKFCTVKKTWSPVRSMLEAREAPAVASVGTSLYVIGGESYRAGDLSPSSIDSCECYDVTVDRWMALDKIPTGRFCARAVVL